jgi:hypothetical protein
MSRYHGGRPRVLAHEHGTRSKYVTDRCRCDACKAANTAYNNERYRAYPNHEQRLIAKYVAEYDEVATDGFIFGTKACDTCGNELPACATYFGVESKTADGLNTTCKTCRRAEVSTRYRDDAEFRERRKAYFRERYAARKGAGA